jgi:hypothetical protein
MKIFGIFLEIRSVLRSLGIFCSDLVYFADIWYIFPVLVCLYQEKYCNPG